jgi:hypothetical protein
MRKLGILFAAIISFSTTFAISQVAPYPFNNAGASVAYDGGSINILTANGVSMDGGFANQMTVLHMGGSPTFDGNLTIQGFASGGHYWGCANHGLDILTTNCGQLSALSTYPMFLDAGVVIGSGAFSNQSPGSCTLSGGTCNAVVPGAQGSSFCYCDIQGANWAIDAGAFTCHARADAGSATVWVQAGATPIPGTATVGVHCDN